MTKALFKLDDSQAVRKAELEKIIGDGIQTFREVGEALSEVRNGKLYADEFETFEEYLKEKWQIGRSQGFRLIDAASVARNVSPVGDISKIIPSERVARVIAPLPKKQQIKVAKALARQAGKVTETIAREAVQKVARGGLATMAFQAQTSSPCPQAEISLNMAPKMTPISKAQAQSTVSEWWAGNRQKLTSYPAASTEAVVNMIIGLFK